MNVLSGQTIVDRVVININYARAPSGDIELHIADQGVISIMLVPQVVILNLQLPSNGKTFETLSCWYSLDSSR